MKRIFTERISENEKEMLELFRTLKSDKLQNKFLGQAEMLILELIAHETKHNLKSKPNLKLIKK